MTVAVAPRVGAWIETHKYIVLLNIVASHPVWVRGLKHPGFQLREYEGAVAPRVGAWIETKGHTRYRP